MKTLCWTQAVICHKKPLLSDPPSVRKINKCRRLKPGVNENRKMPYSHKNCTDYARNQCTITSLKPGHEKTGPAQFLPKPCNNEEADEQKYNAENRFNFAEGNWITAEKGIEHRTKDYYRNNE